MKEKIAYLEVLRIICAVVVVLDHICIAGIHIFDEEATMFDKFFYNGVQHWSHFAVPVFLMITGYLLLEPTRKIGYEKAITKYAWRMVVILLTVGTAFAWLEVYFKTKSFSPSGLFIAFCNTLQGDTWKHLWYLYTLVGLYLIIPVIKPIFERMDTKDLDIFLLLAFFFSSILPTFTSLTNLKFGVIFSINSIFLFYLMVGRRIGVIDSVKGQKINISIVALCVLFLVPFICAYYEYYKGQMNIATLSDYSSPIIVVTSCVLFYIAKCLDENFHEYILWGGAAKMVRHISSNSFGIYVFHMLWVNVLYKVLKFDILDFRIWILVPLLFIILLLSDITTSLFRKIPKIGNYI